MGTIENELVGWHHQLNGHEFGWTPVLIIPCIVVSEDFSYFRFFIALPMLYSSVHFSSDQSFSRV